MEVHQVRVFRYRIPTHLVRVLCAVALFTAVTTSSAPSEPEKPVPTNYELLERAAAGIVDELLANMPVIQQGAAIRLKKGRGVGEIDFVFENVLLMRMQEGGYRVSTEGSEVEGAGGIDDRYRLSFQIIRMSMAYTRIGRRYWIGAKEVDRLAEIGVFAQLADLGSGDIIWVGDAQKRIDDTIRYSQLKMVEEEQYEFTKPERQELRWSRLVEPIIVTGIISGLVYLFFSNQSDE
jgi:hypothetical protein